MSRIQAREAVFKLTYEYLFLNEINTITLESFLEQEVFNDDDKKYIRENYIGIINEIDNIKDIISKNLNKVTIDLLNKTVLSILIVGTYELFHKSLEESIDGNGKVEISDKVIVNEAVEISKKYSDDNSYKFVNGVLAGIIKNVER